MTQLTLLQINDLHGYLDPHPELFRLQDPADFRAGGGLARLVTLFRRVRREVGDAAVVALDNGDTFHGTMPAVQTEGAALIAPLAHLRLDAMTAHWEFAYGLARVNAMTGQLAYPLLAANVEAAAAGLRLPSHVILDRAGLRVAVVGLAAVVAARILPPGDQAGARFTLGDDALRTLIPQLRRDHGADLIVVLSHLGFPQDCKLAAEVPGIDVVLSGHTHHRMQAPATVNGTLIMQSGAHGSFVGRLDLDVAATGIAGWRHALLPVDGRLEPDAQAQRSVDLALAPFAAARARVLGTTTTPLARYSMLEATMDNLLLDGVAAAANVPVALSNGWRYGAPIPAGPLTELDIWNIVPANPPCSVVTLTGAELRRLFEDNLEATFACDPWRQRGGYVKRCRGIRLSVKLENPAGQRIQEFTVGGADLRDRTAYPVAFLGRQAVPEGFGTGRRTLGVTAVEALTQHVTTHDTVSADLRGTVTVV